MPELPEVETTRRGLARHVTGHRIRRLVVRNPRLRWTVPGSLSETVAGITVNAIRRRAKYLLLDCGAGTLIIHLGMSGSLCRVPASRPAGPHDHVDLVLDDGMALRLTDPRRFGSLLWHAGDIDSHPLLKHLGPEPLGDGLRAQWLYQKTRKRKAAVKHVLMNSRIVAGVGNIYANEALFRAGIRPGTPARKIGLERYAKLVKALQTTLSLAIDAGGSSLRNFVGSDGKAGYFQNRYLVYGRARRACKRCGTAIRCSRQASRSSFYCPRCQR